MDQFENKLNSLAKFVQRNSEDINELEMELEKHIRRQKRQGMVLGIIAICFLVFAVIICMH